MGAPRSTCLACLCDRGHGAGGGAKTPRGPDRRRDRAGLSYVHIWRNGDVVMWDNRATMHRGRPWPAHEARLMVRTTISATQSDGSTLSVHRHGRQRNKRTPQPLALRLGSATSPFTSGDRLRNQEDEFSIPHRSGHLPDAGGWSFRTTEPAVILSSFLMYGKIRHSSRNLDFNTAGDGAFVDCVP